MAGVMQEICRDLGIDYVFKGFFDKANRTAASSFRGDGMDAGLQVLEAVRKTGVPVVTDIHLPEQAAEVATVADILQIPAFLCRQLIFCWQQVLQEERSISRKDSSWHRKTWLMRLIRYAPLVT